MEENQGMMIEEVMRDGMKKGVFREGNSPNVKLDFGKHVRKTLEDPGYCGWTMKQEKPGTEAETVQVLSEEGGR